MKIKPLIISLLLIVSVVAILPDATLNLRCNRQLLATWIAMIAFALFFLKNPWLKCFLIWMILRIMWSVGTGNFNGDFYMTLNVIFIFLIAYQFLVNEVKKEHTVYLLNTICIIALAHLLWMGMQLCGLWVFVIPLNIISTSKSFLQNWPLYIAVTPWADKYSLFGLMGNLNTSSALLALGLPAFFRKDRISFPLLKLPKERIWWKPKIQVFWWQSRIQWCWGIPLIWMGIISSHSLGGTIPAGLATLWLVWSTAGRYKYWILFAFASLFISYLLKTENISRIGYCRFSMWWAVFRDLISKHWIIGWGVGKFRIATTNPGGGRTIYGMLHNEWLELWFEQGIVGFGLVMGFIGSAVKNYWFAINKSWFSRIAFIGVLVVILNASVNFLFHVSPGIVGIVWFVILEKEISNANTITS